MIINYLPSYLKLNFVTIVNINDIQTIVEYATFPSVYDTVNSINIPTMFVCVCMCN